MSAESHQDPYRLSPEHIEAPPQTLPGIFRRIGPGLILTSSVVGSGELIATTVLGAENGYSLLWLILLSCTIKIVVQNELGRYAIGTGETTLEAFDRVPGPRFKVSWLVWFWLVVVIVFQFAMGGMLGGIAEVLSELVPVLPMKIWLWVVCIVTSILLIVARYKLLERVALGMVVMFTILTVGCAVLLSRSPDYFSWTNVIDGLRYHRPQGGFVMAVTVFATTGVGALELIVYPYWCIEKGYARYTGLRDCAPAWQERARGWIKVMGVDVLSSWVVYTFTTVAFYFLGAGILNSLGVVPKGLDMVKTLSNMFTVTLGPWSFYLFLVGALAVLYSTVFASIAAVSRGLADFLGLLGVFDKTQYAARLKTIRILAVILPVIPSFLFLFVQSPVFMIKVSGVVQASILPLIGFATIYLRYFHTPKEILPKKWITVALWFTSLVMLIMMGYSVIQELTS